MKQQTNKCLCAVTATVAKPPRRLPLTILSSCIEQLLHNVAPAVYYIAHIRDRWPRLPRRLVSSRS